MSVKFDNTTSLLDPTSGFRAAILLTPTQSFGHSSATFVIAQISGSAYFDLSGSGRSVVAVRGLVGKDYGADHVLSTPSRFERQQLNAAVETAADAVEMILAQGVAAAQNEFNTRQPPDDPSK